MPLHWNSFYDKNYQRQLINSDDNDLLRRRGKTQANTCASCPIVLAKRRREVFFVEKALERANLTFEVIYAEDAFETLLRELLRGEKPFLVFHWSHELANFSLIQPPPCENMKFDSLQCRNDNVCPLEPMTSLKIASDTISKIYLAHQALLEMRFTSSNYRGLLEQLWAQNSSLDEASLNNAACKWMQENRNTWQQWQPELENEDKVEVTLAVYVPENNERYGIMHGFEKAIFEGNKELNRVKLQLIREKDLCDVPGYASLLTQKLSQVKPDGIIGPSCNKNLLAVAGNLWDFQVFFLSGI